MYTSSTRSICYRLRTHSLQQKNDKSGVICTQFSNSSQARSAGSNELQSSAAENFRLSTTDYFTNCEACILSSIATVLLRSQIKEKGSNFSQDTPQTYYSYSLQSQSTELLPRGNSCESILSERSNPNISMVVLKRSCGHKRYPPQVQRPLQTTRAMRKFSGTTLPERALAANNEAI